jgi:hypothetical protein
VLLQEQHNKADTRDEVASHGKAEAVAETIGTDGCDKGVDG